MTYRIFIDLRVTFENTSCSSVIKRRRNVTNILFLRQPNIAIPVWSSFFNLSAWFLAELQPLIRSIRIKFKFPLPSLPYPFTGYAYKAEYKPLDSRCGRDILKDFRDFLNDMVIKVLHHGRHDQKDRIVIHV